MPCVKLLRPLEKGLGEHRKELCGVGRAVGVEDRLLATIGGALVLLKCRLERPGPGSILLRGGKCRRSVEVSVLEVECVCELVKDYVVAIVGRAGAVPHRIPREHDDTKASGGQSGRGAFVLRPHAASLVAGAGLREVLG